MTTVEGADVSHWNAVTPTAGLRFLFVKASEGVSADPMYGTHTAHAVNAGLLPGGYVFARNDYDIDTQARFFVQHAPASRALAVDNEGTHKLDRPHTRQLISAIRSHDPLHRHVGLYMSSLAPFYTDCGQDFNWVADTRKGITAPPVNWHIWQYAVVVYDRDRAVNLAVLNSIFQVPVTPGVPTVHIAHGATVRVYILGPQLVSGQRCILSWKDIEWTRASSHANIYGGEVKRRTCDNQSWAWTVRVKDGAFAGRYIRTRADGVTVS